MQRHTTLNVVFVCKRFDFINVIHSPLSAIPYQMKRLKCRKILFSLCIIVSHKMQSALRKLAYLAPHFACSPDLPTYTSWKARAFCWYPIDGRVVYVKVNLNANLIVAMHVAIYCRLINVLWSISPGVPSHRTLLAQIRWVSCIYDVYCVLFCCVLVVVFCFGFFFSLLRALSPDLVKIHTFHWITQRPYRFGYCRIRQHDVWVVYSAFVQRNRPSEYIWTPVTIV